MRFDGDQGVSKKVAAGRAVVLGIPRLGKAKTHDTGLENHQQTRQREGSQGFHAAPPDARLSWWRAPVFWLRNRGSDRGLPGRGRLGTLRNPIRVWIVAQSPCRKPVPKCSQLP